MEISSNDVMLAIRKLKGGKRDDCKGLSTDHLKRAPILIHGILAHLFNSMIAHGHVVPDMKISTLTPIPKNKNKSLSSSDNYRAIATSSVIGKVMDHVIHAKNVGVFSTSNLQFGYKPGHSTVSCSFVMQEVIQHYVSRRTPILSISLDASKAFDRIEFSSLFEFLIQKNMCALTLRFLFHMYTAQKIRVRWQGALSDEERISNGVKQGGVLSPWLFTVYMDELLTKLRKLSVGCFLGTEYAGALCYADDLMLLSPTVSALKKMLLQVDNFAATYKMTFNPAKSSFVVHGNYNTSSSDLKFTLMGRDIPHAPRVKHLGLVIGDDACAINVRNADMFIGGHVFTSSSRFAFTCTDASCGTHAPHLQNSSLLR